MDPYQALAIATAIVGWSVEFNQKIKQRNEITKNIVSNVQMIEKYIEDVIEKFTLDRAKGYLKSFAKEFETSIREHDEQIETVDKLRENFAELSRKINLLIYELEQYVRSKEVKLIVNVFPIYYAATAIAVAVLDQRKIRFDYYIANEEIIKLLNSNIETQHLIEEYLYTVLEDRGNGVFVKVTHPYHPQQTFFKEVHKVRLATEQNKYKYLLNLNGSFKFKVTDETTQFNGCQFRCSNFRIAEVEGIRALAVNNLNGTITNPSFYKRVLLYYSNIDISFAIKLKTLNANRLIEIAILETDIKNNVIVNEKRERITLDNNWTDYTLVTTKKDENTVLDFEVYWFDNEESDIAVSNTFIDFVNKELALPLDTLPLIQPVAWESRCTSNKLKFDLNESVSTQYISADDTAHKFENPSILQDLDVWPNSIDKYKVVFEALIKTEKDIGREINLVIWDFKNKYPGGSGEKAFESGKMKVSDTWQYFKVEAEIYPSTHIRCEVYWFDDHEVQLFVKEANLNYFV
ncbi:hypothetical protein [Bacillus subtilis]|uniref:hypothetical protein n=1 Tax=Bacillus subtilis TaxID=1423 RepID=UPI001B94C981|nr:hypothetical protein [Bacillus subtilis]CAF1834540.1 hypothetical protein NRS6137_02811 [Bacillus subtilis]